MTTDDNLHDDAEFDAFLKGEGALAESLQAMAQPAPTAALDAAILARAQELMRAEQQPRAAANDPAPAGEPRLAPSFMMRMRVPVVLAASVLLSVMTIQLWQTEPALNRPVVAEMIIAPAAAPPPEPPLMQERAADAVAAKPAPAPVLAQTPPVVAAIPAPAPTPAPAPAPVFARAPAEPAARAYEDRKDSPVAGYGGENAKQEAEHKQLQPEITQRVEITGSAVARRVPAESAMPITSISPAPLATPALERDRPTIWLSAIDELIKAGLKHDAVEEWNKFNRAYPNYPVPEKTRAAIRDLTEAPGKVD
jgi:hypothetical protein